MLANLNEGKLDPRVKRTRRLIRTAFESLLAEKGFESLAVQDITEKAEINRATFYAHFSDKYALLNHTIQQAFLAEIEKGELSMCDYSPAALRNLITIVCAFLVRVHTGCAQHTPQQFESLVESSTKQQIFELLAHWLRNSTFKTEIPTTVATWAIYGLASYYSHLKNRPPIESFVDQALPLVAVNLEQFA